MSEEYDWMDLLVQLSTSLDDYGIETQYRIEKGFIYARFSHIVLGDKVIELSQCIDMDIWEQSNIPLELLIYNLKE